MIIYWLSEIICSVLIKLLSTLI